MSKQTGKILLRENPASRRGRGNPKRDGGVQGRGTRVGAGTRRKILEAAEHALIESGYYQMSLREIAGGCGISVGNLTYHFKTKERLILELIDNILDEYLKEFGKLLARKKLQDETGIKLFIEWLLKDAAKERTARLNRELWMLSSHYPTVRKRMVNLYRELLRYFTEHIAHKYPDLTRHELETVGCLIAVLVEGTGIVYGGRYQLPVKSTEIRCMLVNMVTETIEDGGGSFKIHSEG